MLASAKELNKCINDHWDSGMPTVSSPVQERFRTLQDGQHDTDDAGAPGAHDAWSSLALGRTVLIVSASLPV